MELAFPLETYERRLTNVRARVKEAGLDALVVSLPDNLVYLSGFNSLGYLWFQCLVVPAGDEPVTLITRTTEEPSAAETCWVRDVVGYDIEAEDPVIVLQRVLRERVSQGTGRIGVELVAFTLLPGQWEQLRGDLRVTFEDASMLVVEERLHKDPLELAYQRQAGQMADAALLASLDAFRPGVSEVELAGIVSQQLGAQGSEFAAIPPMIASGNRSAMIHGMASRKSVSRGEPVLVELAGVCNRYHAVLMRTVVIGRPSRRVAEVAGLLAEAMDAAVEAAVPGAPAGAPNAACNAVLDRLDLVRRRSHRIGYSLGLAYPPTWLEAMMLTDTDPHPIEPGISFTLEPNLSLPDEGFGLKLGETVACGEIGPERLTALDHELIIV